MLLVAHGINPYQLELPPCLLKLTQDVEFREGVWRGGVLIICPGAAVPGQLVVTTRSSADQLPSGGAE